MHFNLTENLQRFEYFLFVASYQYQRKKLPKLHVLISQQIGNEMIFAKAKFQIDDNYSSSLSKSYSYHF